MTSHSHDLVDAFAPASRLDGLGLSAIMRVEAEAERRRRAGSSIVSLSVGESYFPTPAHVVAAAVAAMEAGQTRYTATDGTPELKAAVAAAALRDDGRRVEADEIICSSGTKQVVSNALLALLEPGDEVLVPSPFWTSYADMVKLAGGRFVPVATRAECGFRLRADDLARAIGPRTRVLLLNSPCNPTGAVLSHDDLLSLAEVLERVDIHRAHIRALTMDSMDMNALGVCS